MSVSQSILELFWTITIVIVQNNSKMECDNDRINTSGDTTPRRTLRAGAAAYAMLARFSTRTT